MEDGNFTALAFDDASPSYDDDGAHHLAKRFVWPGISVEEVFLLLFRPERFMGWLTTSAFNAAFRMVGIVIGGEDGEL